MWRGELKATEERRVVIRRRDNVVMYMLWCLSVYPSDCLSLRLVKPFMGYCGYKISLDKRMNEHVNTADTA